MNLISVSDLIKQSWQIYKNNFKTFTSITIWLLPFIILSLLADIGLNNFLEDVTPESTTSNIGVLGGLGIVSLLLFFVYVVAIMVIAIITIQVAQKLYLGESVSPKEMIKPAINRIAGYLWVNIIMSVLIFIGFLIFIIPGIILAIWYSFSEQVFVLENVRGYNALKRSKELVEGKWWAVLWRWLGPSLFYGIIIGIVSVIVFILLIKIGFPETTFSDMMFPDKSTNDTLSTIFDSYQGILSIFTIPLFTIIGVILYNNLKSIKEAPSKDQNTST